MTANNEPEKKTMKFRVHMKDPDGIYESFADAAKTEAARIVEASGGMLTTDDITDTVREKIEKAVGGFFEYGDYCVVECDTDTGTCVVVKKGD